MADWRAAHIANLYDKCDAATARAEAAEAEVTRLRALADDPTTNPYWRLRAERAEAAIERVRALHTSDAFVTDMCRECAEDWPCPTIAALDSTQPDTPAPGRSGEEKRFCPRCGSPRWVSVSLDEGWTRRAQCVPCGAYHPGVIGPGWRAQTRSDAGLPVDGEERK